MFFSFLYLQFFWSLLSISILTRFGGDYLIVPPFITTSSSQHFRFELWIASFCMHLFYIKKNELALATCVVTMSQNLHSSHVPVNIVLGFPPSLEQLHCRRLSNRIARKWQNKAKPTSLLSNLCAHAFQDNQADLEIPIIFIEFVSL